MKKMSKNKKVIFNKEYFVNLAQECGINYSYIEVISSHNIRDLVVKDELLDRLIAVQNKFNQLEEMDDDEYRGFFIELPRITPENWCNCEMDLLSCYPLETQWYHVGVSKYREFRALKFTDLSHYYSLIVNEDRGCATNAEYYKEYLLLIFDYLERLLDDIVLNPESFNDYVVNNLPYQQRSGSIPRKELNRIEPKLKIKVNDMEVAIKALEASVNKEYGQLYDKMTIRMFCKYYRIGHRAYLKNVDRLKDESDELDDVEYYKRAAFKHIDDEYNLDSEEDFKKFARDHYGELGLSRLDIGATNFNMPGWAIYVSNSYSAWVDVAIEVATAIYKTGAPLIIYSAEKLLKILTEEDNVALIPYTFHDYMNHHEEGTVLKLPWEYELSDSECDNEYGLTKEQLNKIISLATWEEIKRVKVKK